MYGITKKLNRKKAQGYDEITTSFMKDGADMLAEPPASLINRCLQNSLFLSTEKCAKITLIHHFGQLQAFHPTGAFQSV